jgi:hypothetical protein
MKSRLSAAEAKKALRSPPHMLHGAVLNIIIIISNFQAWANWSIPRQLISSACHVLSFNGWQALLNPDSSARAI